MVDNPDFSIEESYNTSCCGIDEAGRGTLVGPVVAACVFIPKENKNLPIWNEINDSKKLSAKKREYLYDKIRQSCYCGIGQATIEEIDDINILNATMLAMKESYKNMEFSTEISLIDGNRAPEIENNIQTIIKGDSKSISIAAASIIAKVYRDNLLKKLGEEYPEYKWDKNSGYGTKEHLEAIYKYGITPYHRKSFAPIKNIIKAA